MINTGRPQDSAIEVEFMRKLRGPKLQFINAESELQIFLAELEKKDPTNKQKVTPQHIMEFLVQHLKKERMEKILSIIEAAEKKWVFTDIKDAKDFPKYLFDDESDPAYWLDEIRQAESITKFTSQELFFVELICLVKREQITLYILGKYKQDYDNIMKLMKIAEEKIDQKKDLPMPSGQSVGDQHDRREEDESYNQDKGDSDDEDSPSSKISGKKKKIKKEKKKGSKNEKKRKARQEQQSEEQDEEQGDNPVDQIQEDKKLALRTVNHIAWAYFYIISS